MALILKKKKAKNGKTGNMIIFALFLIPVLFALFPVETGAETMAMAKENEILVKYKGSEDIVKIRIGEGDSMDEALNRYAGRRDIEYSEPNHIYRASILPSDTYFQNQWYLKKIKAPEAWNILRESPEIKIAVLDSGVDISHPDLRDNIWTNKKEIPGNGLDDDKNGFVDDVNGWDFVRSEGDPAPKFDDGYTPDGVTHGTIVAGIAAASGNNAAGVSGVTWKAKIMPLVVLDQKGEGDTNGVVKAIDYAIKQEADIINLSFVGFGFSQSMKAAIERAYRAGIIIVAAAGNEGQNGGDSDLDKTPMYPVCHDGANGENMVIGVAAVDALDQKAPFSGYGYKCIDVSAPGISIFGLSVYEPDKKYADNPFNKYYDGYWSGTSMAVPMVSATAALLKAANPGLGRSGIIETIKSTSDNINQLNPDFLGQLGRGRLNILSAVTEAYAQIESKQINLLFAPLSGEKSTIKITDVNGKVISAFLAYAENFRGGAAMSGGDVDGDGLAEIVTGAGPGGGPHVRIFDIDGKVKGQFFAYGENFRGGVNVAVGDVDGDGLAEIVTGAGPGGGPQVRIFSDGLLEGQFFAFSNDFRGGINVRCGNTERGTIKNKEEIIVSPASDSEPIIRIFDNHARLLNQFAAFGRSLKSGVRISSADTDNDGLEEIIAGAGPGGTPHVRIFEKDGQIAASFYAYDPMFSGGVSVGSFRTAAGVNDNINN